MADAAKFSFPKLSNSNWSVWRFRMEMLLTREELWHVIDEAKPEPVTAQWTKEDKKARATIGLTIEDNQLGLIKNATSALAMWTALRTHHEKATVTSRVSLLKKLCNKNLHEGGDMEVHLLDIEELCDRLQAAGLELAQEMKVAMVLRSLPDTYNGLVTGLESRPDQDITMELVKSKLRDEHQKRVDRGDGSDDCKALKTSTNTKAAVKVCFYCEKPGHFRKNCRKYLASLKAEADNQKQQDSASSEGPKAKQAQGSGAPVCFWANAHIRATDVIAEEERCYFSNGPKGKSKSNWFVDTGATQHMTSNKAFFSELELDVKIDVTLANGKKTVATGVGNGMLVCVDGNGKRREVEVRNVLYVPDLEGSLLSVSTLIAKNLSVVVDSHGCRVRDANGQTVAVADLCGGMYLLKCSDRSMIGGTARRKDLEKRRRRVSVSEDVRFQGLDAVSPEGLPEDAGSSEVEVWIGSTKGMRSVPEVEPDEDQEEDDSFYSGSDSEGDMSEASDAESNTSEVSNDEAEGNGESGASEASDAGTEAQATGKGVKGIRRSQRCTKGVLPWQLKDFIVGYVGIAASCGEEPTKYEQEEDQ